MQQRRDEEAHADVICEGLAKLPSHLALRALGVAKVKVSLQHAQCTDQRVHRHIIVWYGLVLAALRSVLAEHHAEQDVQQGQDAVHQVTCGNFELHVAVLDLVMGGIKLGDQVIEHGTGIQVPEHHDTRATRRQDSFAENRAREMDDEIGLCLMCRGNLGYSRHHLAPRKGIHVIHLLLLVLGVHRVLQAIVGCHYVVQT
mmetsp:Transcript_103090/g.266547  ORF Transcript_103090/g.266547 Transcript_103090/m.266547 type:complete len:200 (-) Transcript_103090:676-1275(-)